jgi:hypothetical protein
VLRALFPVSLLFLNACALRHARLDASRERVVTQSGDASCGPLGIRRSSLGARWGEYVRVSVTAPSVLTGEARLHVDGRASTLQQFTTAPTLDVPMQVAEQVATAVPAMLPLPKQTIVLDAAWTNERLDVPAAIEAGHVIDITLVGLNTPEGNCSEVVFTVEQGVFKPTVDERLWIAELIRRGGPELQKWLAAEEQRKEAVRRAHYAEADRRKVEWLAQAELRRTQARAEAAARAESERVELAARAEAERKRIAAEREATRLEAQRRQVVRELHFAEYERRREARAAGSTNDVAVSVVVVTAPPKRSLVCRPRVSSSGAFSAGVSTGATSSLPMVADDSCEEVIETSAATTSSVDVRVVRTESLTPEPAAASVTTSYDTRASVTLQGEAVTAQRVAEVPVMEVKTSPEPEWATPASFSMARAAVTTEQVAAQAPALEPASRPATVTEVDGAPVDILFALFGAVLDVAVRSTPQHAVVPVAPARVHLARPVAQLPSVNTASPNIQPVPPAPR